MYTYLRCGSPRGAGPASESLEVAVAILLLSLLLLSILLAPNYHILYSVILLLLASRALSPPWHHAEPSPVCVCVCMYISIYTYILIIIIMILIRLIILILRITTLIIQYNIISHPKEHGSRGKTQEPGLEPKWLRVIDRERERGRLIYIYIYI